MKNTEQNNNHRPIHPLTENTRKPGQPQSFQVWLRSIPAIITGDQAVLATVTLSLDDWFSVCQAAVINRKSIDEIVSYIVRERVDLTDWLNEKYAMKTAEENDAKPDGEKSAGNSGWVKLPSGLRERAERDCEKFKVDVPFEFLVRDALETQIRCLEDERNRENIRDAWRDA